jgi:hypothetical protein
MVVIFGTGSWLFGQEKPNAPVDGRTQEVVAEGVGTTADEAIKDAYRNAVRQVVGAVVDAETLVKNDELIDDKVLTYSDGFIKGYEEVDGSKKVKDGLHRIKIKAQVERRSVIAKLKATNISVKQVDGKSMFAEIVTQEEGETDASELVLKSLADLPTLLTATVKGKPEFDRAKSEIVIRVDVAVDQRGYDAFVKRIEPILKKLAIAKGSIVLKAVHDQVRDPKSGRMIDAGENSVVVNDAKALAGPQIQRGMNNVWCLWVCSFTSGKFSTQRWNSYVLPGDAAKSFTPILMPSAKDLVNDFGVVDINTNPPDQMQRPNDARTQLRVTLNDITGMVVTQDERELTTTSASFSEGQSKNRLPLMRVARFRDFDGANFADPKYEPSLDPSKRIYNGFIAPFSISPTMYGQAVQLHCTGSRVVEFRFKVTSEELKAITDVKCEIEYSPDPNHIAQLP